MKIEFRGRKVEVEQLEKGVVKKNDKIYYIKDSVTKEWLYCNATRLEKLTTKFGTLKVLGKKYIGRKGKNQQVAEVMPEVKAVEPEVKAEVKAEVPVVAITSPEVPVVAAESAFAAM